MHQLLLSLFLIGSTPSVQAENIGANAIDHQDVLNPVETTVDRLSTDAETYFIVMSDGTRKETQNLVYLYSQIAASPESQNITEIVDALTQDFAQVFAGWSVDIARDSYGGVSIRKRMQERFVLDFFAALAESNPFESSKVALQFQNSLMAALAQITVKQQLEVSKLEAARNSRRWSLSIKKGAVCVGIALAIFQGFHHVIGSNDFVAYLSALSGFGASFGLLRGPLREAPGPEQTAYAIAARANARIYERVCQNLLVGPKRQIN